jgi:hypothetical protein
VVCIGAGPGTDIFSVLAVQDLFFGEKVKRLHFQVFDQAASQWKASLDQLLKDTADLPFTYEYNTIKFPDATLDGQDEPNVVFNQCINISLTIDPSSKMLEIAHNVQISLRAMPSK